MYILLYQFIYYADDALSNIIFIYYADDALSNIIFIYYADDAFLSQILKLTGMICVHFT